MTTSKKETAVKNVTSDNVLTKAHEAKAYSKSFKGVRASILAGKIDAAIEVTAFDLKVLKASKKDSALYTYLLENCEYKGTFERADGSKGSYNNVFAPHRLFQVIARIANNEDLQVKFSLKF